MLFIEDEFADYLNEDNRIYTLLEVYDEYGEAVNNAEHAIENKPCDDYKIVSEQDHHAVYVTDEETEKTVPLKN